MVKYYYFIRSGQQLTPDSVIYHIKVGSDSDSQAKLTLVQLYVKDSGDYFKVRSECSRKTIQIMSQNIMKGYIYALNAMRQHTMSVGQLYRHIIDNDWDLFEGQLAEPRAYFLHLSAMGTNFFPSRLIQRVAKTARSVKRKNLSNDVCSENFIAAISYAVIILLFTIGALIEGIERAHYIF